MKTEQIQQHRNFIGGKWVPASGGSRYAIHNPARPRECLGEFADSTEADVATAIDAARSAADAWANTPPPAARRRALPVRPAPGRIQDGARPDRHARTGQGARRGSWGGRTRRRRSAVHGGRGQPRGGTDVPERASRLHVPHGRRTARRHRRDLTLEFSGRHARPQDCARADVGKHRRLQALVAHAVVRRVSHAAAREGRPATARREPRDRSGRARRRRTRTRPPNRRDYVHGLDDRGHADLRRRGATAGASPTRARRQEPGCRRSTIRISTTPRGRSWRRHFSAAGSGARRSAA